MRNAQRCPAFSLLWLAGIVPAIILSGCASAGRFSYQDFPTSNVIIAPKPGLDGQEHVLSSTQRERLFEILAGSSRPAIRHTRSDSYNMPLNARYVIFVSEVNAYSFLYLQEDGTAINCSIAIFRRGKWRKLICELEQEMKLSGK